MAPLVFFQLIVLHIFSKPTSQVASRFHGKVSAGVSHSGVMWGQSQEEKKKKMADQTSQLGAVWHWSLWLQHLRSSNRRPASMTPRLWGTGESMWCHHGFIPGELLSCGNGDQLWPRMERKSSPPMAGSRLSTTWSTGMIRARLQTREPDRKSTRLNSSHSH